MLSNRDVPVLACYGLLFSLLLACSEPITEAPIDVPAFSTHNGGPVVNSADDPGDGVCDAAHCTLREAIGAAVASDEITFDPALDGSTIVLGGSPLVIDRNLTITGPGASELTIDGDLASRVLVVNSGVTAGITGITLARGFTSSLGQGAALDNDGVVELEQCVVREHSAPGTFVIRNDGSLVLRQCTLSDNRGSILIDRATTIEASTLTRNVVERVLVSQSGAVPTTILNSTISGNTISIGVVVGGFAAIVRSSTIVGNRLLNFGSSLSFSDLTISSSIVAGNAAGSGQEECDATSLISSGDNIFGRPNFCTLAAGDQEISFDPFERIVGPLGDNGGPTWTHALLDPEDTGFANPAIDAANCAAHGITTDQRGIARPQDVASVPDTHDGCDIGAFEIEVPAPPPCTLEDLGAQVDALQASGVLNAGQARALDRKLDQSASLLDRGKTDEAMAVLDDFRSQVSDLEADGVLSGDQAASLDLCAASVADG
jgi:CSLREA domain-containing protein